MTRAAIGVGSNLGDSAANVRTALAALESVGRVAAVSRLYRTTPWGKRDQPDFCNAAAIVETDLGPRALLERLKDLERELGRIPGERWGPRSIDLDILTYGGERICEPGLEIPHPQLRERAFALVPLSEIDPAYEAEAAALPQAERAGVFPLE